MKKFFLTFLFMWVGFEVSLQASCKDVNGSSDVPCQSSGIFGEGVSTNVDPDDAYCLMPNHFHLLLIPQEEKSLSRLMQWVMTSHVRYYHKKNKTSGHIWQGRYKSFMVEKESYYLTLIRYIETNAHRAKLTKKAQDWKYGSLYERVTKNRELLNEPYVTLYDEWINYVNQPLREGELENIRNSVNRQAPLGQEQWQVEIATKYGMLSTLRSRGRPSL